MQRPAVGISPAPCPQAIRLDQNALGIYHVQEVSSTGPAIGVYGREHHSDCAAGSDGDQL